MNGRDIGFGRGFSQSLAKRGAAVRSLRFLDSSANVASLLHDTLGSASRPDRDPDPFQELQEYLICHPGGSLIPLFSWSVSETVLYASVHHATARCHCESFIRINMLSSELVQSMAAKLAAGRAFPPTMRRELLPCTP